MKKRAALYDPYLDVMGGGEKHILSILQVLETNGYEVSVFWNGNLGHAVESKLNLRFRNLRFEKNIFAGAPVAEKLKALSGIDILLYVTDGSYFFSTAKKNFVFAMVPQKDLYRMSPANRVKTLNFRFIANSNYTASWLRKWGIASEVIYPYISPDLLEGPAETKEDLILSVGRFFPHLHSKKHRELIDAFNRLAPSNPHLKLVLAGGIKDEDRGYLEELKAMIGSNRNIRVEANVPYRTLVGLYKKAKIFWHFAGFGEDENSNPERVEHLGMTPLEAMAAGAVPFCFAAGGPKEIIREGENGFLFSTAGELLEKTAALLGNRKHYEAMQRTGREFVAGNFGWEVFKKHVEETIL